MALQGLDLFKALQEHKGIFADIRRNYINMDRIANTSFTLNGDTATFDDVIGVDVGDGEQDTNAAFRTEVIALASQRATFTLTKLMDKAFSLNKWRVNMLETMAVDQQAKSIATMSSKIDRNIVTVQCRQHIQTTADALTFHVTTETNLYKVIEEMISNVVTGNSSKFGEITREDVVVMVSPKVSTELRLTKYDAGMSNIVGFSDPSTVTNTWGAGDLIEIPASMVPTIGTAPAIEQDILVYVKNWSLFASNIKSRELYEGTEVKLRGYVVDQLLESYDSKVLLPAELPELIGLNGLRFEYV